MSSTSFLTPTVERCRIVDTHRPLAACAVLKAHGGLNRLAGAVLDTVPCPLRNVPPCVFTASVPDGRLPTSRCTAGWAFSAGGRDGSPACAGRHVTRKIRGSFVDSGSPTCAGRHDRARGYESVERSCEPLNGRFEASSEVSSEAPHEWLDAAASGHALTIGKSVGGGRMPGSLFPRTFPSRTSLWEQSLVIRCGGGPLRDLHPVVVPADAQPERSATSGRGGVGQTHAAEQGMPVNDL